MTFTPPEPQHPRWHASVAVRVVAGIVLGLLLCWLLACGFLFVHTPLRGAGTQPGAADAVVVLGGASKERLPRALELMRQGAARILVLSNPNSTGNASADKLCHEASAGETASSTTDRPQPDQVNDDGASFALECFTPNPTNTRGEARAIARLAKEKHWTRVILVTSRYHETRAALLLHQCAHYVAGRTGDTAASAGINGDGSPTHLQVLAAPSEPALNLRGWVQRFVIESAGTASVLLHPACK